MKKVAKIIWLKWTGGWFRCLMYRLVMPGPHVNGLFQIRKFSKVHTNDQTVLILLVKDEQTCLHICAKRIWDRLLTFDIIDQKASRSYGKQDSIHKWCVMILYKYSNLMRLIDLWITWITWILKTGIGLLYDNTSFTILYT
jgi:hypothetical protein